MGKLNLMLFKIKVALLLLFIFCSQIFSQELQFGGYTKYLFSTYKTQNLPEYFTDHTLHSRFNLKFFLNDNLTFTSAFRNRIIFGESIEKIKNFSAEISKDEYLMGLNTFLWNKKKSINFIEIDRLYFDFFLNKIQLSIGRQRIAWGTSWVWNITDLFNPLSILDFDYEERPASDAIRFQFYPSTISRIDFATRFGREKKDFSSAIQYYYNIWEYDLNFLFGYHRLRPVIGFSWAGDILDAGFRGEVLITSPPTKMNLITTNSYKNEKKTQIGFVLSLDYTFENSFYIHSEILHNNIGKSENINLFTKDATEIGMLSASKWNLFYQLGYNTSPLSRFDIIILHNPLDHSFVILPTFNYSVIENLDLSLVSLFFEGNDFDEYSPTGKMFFIRLKYSF